MSKTPAFDFSIGGMTEAPTDPIDELADVNATFANRLKRFVALEHARRELETQLEDNKKRAAAISTLLLEDFGEAGLQNVKCDGLTVYIRVDRYVTKKGDVDSESICGVLSEIGRDDLVKAGYNANSLKSWVLEQIEQRLDLRRQIDQLIASKQTPTPAMVDQLASLDKLDRLLPMLNVGEVPRIVTTK
jgi:hypothetical protein